MKHSYDSDDFVVLLVKNGDRTLIEKIRLTEDEKTWFRRVHDLLTAEEGMLVA